MPTANAVQLKKVLPGKILGRKKTTH